MSTILSLPREIVMDIVSRLSISSILQIKLVCKPWWRLLQDPHLHHLHFSRSRASFDPCLILHSRNSTNNEIYFVDLSASTCNNHESSSSSLSSAVVNDGVHDHDHDWKLKKLPVPSTIPSFVILGSYRGILFLEDASRPEGIYLYNPLMAELKEIPKTITGPNYMLGFGFDPATKEHRVVAIESVLNKPASRPRRLSNFESALSVLTLAAGNSTGPTSWRKLGLVPYRFIQQAHQVPVLGRLHWTARRRVLGARKRMVVSFGLSDETVREVPMPPICTCARNCRCQFEVMIVGSCLGIVEYNVGNGKIKIWVMKDYGVEPSWVNEISIDGMGELAKLRIELEDEHVDRTSLMARRLGICFRRLDFRVLWVMKNGEVLLEYRKRGLFCYNPRDGSLRNHVMCRSGGLLADGFNAIVHEGSCCEIDSSIIMSNM